MRNNHNKSDYPFKFLWSAHFLPENISTLKAEYNKNHKVVWEAWDFFLKQISQMS